MARFSMTVAAKRPRGLSGEGATRSPAGWVVVMRTPGTSGQECSGVESMPEGIERGAESMLGMGTCQAWHTALIFRWRLVGNEAVYPGKPKRQHPQHKHNPRQYHKEKEQHHQSKMLFGDIEQSIVPGRPCALLRVLTR